MLRDCLDNHSSLKHLCLIPTLHEIIPGSRYMRRRREKIKRTPDSNHLCRKKHFFFRFFAKRSIFVSLSRLFFFFFGKKFKMPRSFLAEHQPGFCLWLTLFHQTEYLCFGYILSRNILRLDVRYRTLPLYLLPAMQIALCQATYYDVTLGGREGQDFNI